MFNLWQDIRPTNMIRFEFISVMCSLPCSNPRHCSAYCKFVFSVGVRNMHSDMKLTATHAKGAKTLANSTSRRPEPYGRLPGPGFGPKSVKTSAVLFFLPEQSQYSFIFLLGVLVRVRGYIILLGQRAWDRERVNGRELVTLYGTPSIYTTPGLGHEKIGTYRKSYKTEDTWKLQEIIDLHWVYIFC